MMRKYVDLQAGFISMFDDKTGFYARTGMIEFENGKMIDTGVDPFRASFPQLIDVGVMGSRNLAHIKLCEPYYSAGVNIDKILANGIRKIRLLI